MTDPSVPTNIRVGDWTAERSTGRLSRGGEERLLEPKVMDLLLLLASAPNRVFLKEEIHERLWPGVTVGDDSLARCVSKLRKALSDDAAAPRFVETIAKRGYRLIASTAVGTDAARPGEAPPPVRRPLRPYVVAAAGAACLIGLAFIAGRTVVPDITFPAANAHEADEARLRRLSEIDRAEALAKQNARTGD